MIIDIYSRYVTGWLLAARKSSTPGEQLLADTCFKQNTGHGQLTVHADPGSSMSSKPVALLLSDLGVTKSHSRPHVSNDNSFSESEFRTLVPAGLPRAVRPRSPHACIALRPPLTSTTDTTQINAAPRAVLDAAYAARPEGSCASHPNHPHSPTPPGSKQPDTGRRLSTFSMKVSRKRLTRAGLETVKTSCDDDAQ